MVYRSIQCSFNDTLLKFFASPHIPKSVFINVKVKELINAANSISSIATEKALNSQLLRKDFITKIKELVHSS